MRNVLVLLLTALSLEVAQAQVRWTVSVTFKGYVRSTDKSENTFSSYGLEMSGSADLILEGSLPDKNGNFYLSTSQNKVLDRHVTGMLTEQSNAWDKDVLGAIVSKRKDQYAGGADPSSGEFEFECGDGTCAFNGSIGFDRKGTIYMWQNTSVGITESNDPYSEGFGAHTALIGGNDDQVKKIKNGYIIDGVRKYDTVFTQMGVTSRMIRFAEYHVVILLRHHFDAYIHPLDQDYAKWLPEGSEPNGHALGNSTRFSVYVQDPAKPNQKINDVIQSVRFILDQPSHEPGTAINFPVENPNVSSDLQLIKKNAQPDTSREILDVTIQKEEDPTFTVGLFSFDYGSYGRLRALVTLTTGEVLEARSEEVEKPYVLIPFRKDESSKIGQAWKDRHGILDVKDDNDEEKTNGNNHDGDGFTLYEEYRGVIAKGKHIRLDPKKKELIVASLLPCSISSALSIFQSATSGQIIPIEVKPGEELNVSEAIVNKNSLIRIQDQYGIIIKILEEEAGQDSTEVGEVKMKDGVPAPDPPTGSHVASEPIARCSKDVKYLGISKSTVALGASNIDFTTAVAHELAHCLGVKHHGDVKPYFFSSFDRYLVQQKGFEFIDEEGKRVDSTLLLEVLSHPPPDMEAALPHSQASGAADCIMCYNRYFEYSFPDGIKGKKLILCDTHHKQGTTFCTSAIGTDRNDPTRKNPAKPEETLSVFGNAEVGNCLGQIVIKDF